MSIERTKEKEIFFMTHSIQSRRDCRVVRDPQTLKSKGYGFVSFVKKSVSIKCNKFEFFFVDIRVKKRKLK